MKKGKRLFTVIFYGFLIFASTFIISMYDNAKLNPALSNVKNVEYYYSNELQMMTMDLAKAVDPTYTPFTFPNNISDADRESITHIEEVNMAEIRNRFYSDPGFVIRVTNTITGETISNNIDLIHENDNKEEYAFYAKFKYDENGFCVSKGDIIDSLFKYDYLSELATYNSHYYDYNQLDSIIVNEPKNIEIEYIVPHEGEEYGYLSSYINSWDKYNPFVFGTLLIATVLLVLIIFVYPIKYVELTNPFSIIKNWKAELNIIILSFSITFMVLLCATISGNTINGYLPRILEDYGMWFANDVVNVANIFVWFITFLTISAAIFLIKYIFSKGFIRYLREDTIIGSSLEYLKEQLNSAFKIDLSENLTTKILKFVIINLICMLLITSFWLFGYIFAIIYAVFLFIYIKKQIKKIQNDYDHLLHATQELGKGNFDEEIKSDVGIFNSLKDEFNSIKNGFEKAVKEETKSQNMKTELISNVSHDLKTPLTCIKNYIVLLQDDDLSEEDRKDYVDNLNKYANRLNTLIEDLFEVSKANSGNIKIDPVRLNIVALLEQAYAENEEFLQAKDLTVVKKVDKEEIFLYLDGDKTYRIFENLFTNIGKYAMPHSRVYLNISDDDEKAVIELKNISEVQMSFTTDEITERFVRGDKSRHETGSGLGLAIAKSFTEIQGGQFGIAIDCDLFKVKIEFPKKNMYNSEN